MDYCLDCFFHFVGEESSQNPSMSLTLIYKPSVIDATTKELFLPITFTGSMARGLVHAFQQQVQTTD